MSLRGKKYNDLSEEQQAWVHSLYLKFRNSRAGRNNPITIEGYLLKLSAEWIKHMILAIICFSVTAMVVTIIILAGLGRI